MLITRKSALTGKKATKDIPIVQSQLDLWHNGELIQNCMPLISAEDREFIMTGITNEEWEELFGGLE